MQTEKNNLISIHILHKAPIWSFALAFLRGRQKMHRHVQRTFIKLTIHAESVHARKEVLTYKNPFVWPSQPWVSHSTVVEHLTGHEFKPSWGRRGWKHLTKTNLTLDKFIIFWLMYNVRANSLAHWAFSHPFPPSLPEVP